MKAAFSNRFSKQLDKMDAAAKEAVGKAVQKLLDASALSEVPNVKKMKGHKTAYRIRTGDYRIGFYFEDGEAFVVAVAHRKDIYKYFP